VPQLSDGQQRRHASHEPAQGAVSELGIPCGGTSVYSPRHRSEWLSKIPEAGVRRRAEHFYQQLDALQLCVRKRDVIY
jgi:hypothetical protein